MRYDDAVKMAEELIDDEKDDYAIWLSFEDQHNVYDTADPIRHTDDGVKGVELRGDPEIVSPQILSKDVRDIPDDVVLHDPPLGLVKQLIEPSRKNVDRPGFEQAIFRDRLFYEVEKVEYRFALDAIEDVMRLGELREIFSQAKEGRWTMELSDQNELVFWRAPEPGAEYTDQQFVFKLDATSERDMGIDGMLEHVRLEEQLAQYALETIDGEQTMEITERIERHVQDDQPVQMFESEEDALEDSLTFEMEEDEVTIGEQIVTLGGLYMTRTPDA